MSLQSNPTNPNVTTTEFSVKRVIVESSIPVGTALTRLDVYLNKSASSELLPKLQSLKTKEEIEAYIKELLADNDFIFFNSFDHGSLFSKYYENKDVPVTIQYVLGSPLSAQSMMQHDLLLALNVPLRILVSETVDRTGTRIAYLLPSSVLAIGDTAEKLRVGAKMIDDKLGALIEKVLLVEPIEARI